MTDKRKVVIGVYRGVADVINAPDDVEVVIVDWDALSAEGHCADSDKGCGVPCTCSCDYCKNARAQA